MRSLGIALLVASGLGWMIGGNAIIGPRRLRRGEKPLLFDLRPLPRLSDLSSLQKRKLFWLLVSVMVIGGLGLAMVQGVFDVESLH